MTEPLVSIVIPTYNQRYDFLKECLKGAVGQTYGNLEIIVSNNHSDNGALERVLNELPRERFKVIMPPQHMNMVDHFIFASAAANGEYISLLSSDDVLYPECIAKVVKPLIDNPRLSFSYCENELIDEAGNRKMLARNHQFPSGIYSNRVIARRMYNYSAYWIIGGVIRHDCFRRAGIDKEIQTGDWLLGFRLLKFGDVGYVNEALSAIRLHERQGEARLIYDEWHVRHNMQRAQRHELLIRDEELLRAIGITKEEAITFRDREILGSIIVLVRQYHAQQTTRETINKIFDEYKKTGKGFSFRFLVNNYTSRFALAYTYLLGLQGRVKKALNKKD